MHRVPIFNPGNNTNQQKFVARDQPWERWHGQPHEVTGVDDSGAPG